MADLRAPGALDAPEALVPLARSGDRLAFARIVRLHRADMARVAFVITANERLSVEAVRRAWPVAARGLGSLRDPARLGPWLAAIAAREARGLAGRGAATTPESRGRPDTADPAIADALASLSPDDRVLLALRHLAGVSPEELALAAGRREADALARVAEAQARLGQDVLPDLVERLRAYATIPLPPVDIDAEARRAILTRNDHRIRVASLAVAIVVTVIVVSFSYVVGPLPLPPDLVPASPSPTVDPAPASPGPES